ncbi:protein ENHANCED DISEASE RESISTANCE 4-like isoform X1 [Triticum urartu]|uniref:Zinc-ribbon domain-containing protein n=1 Tax=Triticum urartu TaxID=4572 RepID=A0A8R7TD60_TRIUA|nr:protein ENHANCED DISEASE RESISTANCE 4-like isoform X1 [Triticum urartu]
MAISDTSGGARHVRCPRCRSVLQEPAGVPVYQCGGCGASLRAKLPGGDTRGASVSAAPSTESVLPSPRRSQAQSGQLGGSGDVASTSGTTPDAPSTSGTTPDAPSTSYRGAGTTSRREAGDLTPPVVERKGRDHHRSADQAEAAGSSQPRITRGAVSAPNASAAPSSASVLPSPRRSQTQSSHFGSGDVASTSAPAPTPDVRTTSPRDAGTTSRRETGRAVGTSGDQTPARKHHSSAQSPPIVEKKGHDHHHRSADQEEAGGSSEHRRGRGAVSAPAAGANFAEMRGSERARDAEPETDAARKKSPSPSRAEAAPMPDRAADSRSAPAAASWKRRDDAAAAPVPAVTEEKAPSPPRHAPQKMSPLHEKILKTVDELKGDLSELFSQPPEAKPRTPSRPPRRPRQEGHAPHPAVPTSRARHATTAAALHHRGNAGKHGQATLRGLPSRRYRRCRADPCGGHDARPAGACRHSCCDHVRPECGSCRGHCCRPSRAQEPARPAAAEAKKRAPPPRHHCRPVLKGAPFIVCSSCFTLVQVPAGFAVASAKVRDLRCGACSAVLSYSYRDPDRKKPADECSTAGSSPARHVGARPDLFSFIEDFAAEYGASSYSTTEDEQPLHVSRNSSFDTVVAAGEEAAAARRHSHSLHRLMGYGSASELLLRRSPSLYEYGSPGKRSTPPSDASRRHDDRKGKGICVEDFTGDEDSDDSCTLRRSNGRRSGWTPGHGVPAAGAIRIR